MDDELDMIFDDDAPEDTIEAFCMTCKEKTPMENPEPIWTQRGAPGTRGTCSVCGTTMFVMGRTQAHALMRRPEPVQIAEPARTKGRGGRKLEVAVTFINHSVSDAGFAATLAADLNKLGIQTWLAEKSASSTVQWATRVHPALVECKNMIVVLSPFGTRTTSVIEAWEFFLQARKPVYVVLAEPTEVPDVLRTKPRFDFSAGDTRAAFRQLVQVLTG